MNIQKELNECNNWILEQDDDFVTGYGQGNYALGLARLAWQAAKAQAKADTKRIDFLADKSQSVANVMLPTKIVERNLSSLRDAIDQAMMIEVQDND